MKNGAAGRRSSSRQKGGVDGDNVDDDDGE